MFNPYRCVLGEKGYSWHGLLKVPIDEWTVKPSARNSAGLYSSGYVQEDDKQSMLENLYASGC